MENLTFFVKAEKTQNLDDNIQLSSIDLESLESIFYLKICGVRLELKNSHNINSHITGKIYI